MEYKVGDTVRILHNQGQNSLYKKGDIGKIINADDGVKVLFDNGQRWWIWQDGDAPNGDELKAEDVFEVCDTLLAPVIERKIHEIAWNADAVAHLRGYEYEILPATDLIRNMLDLLKEHGILHELNLPKPPP